MCIMPKLPTHLVRELNVATIGIIARLSMPNKGDKFDSVQQNTISIEPCCYKIGKPVIDSKQDVPKKAFGNRCIPLLVFLAFDVLCAITCICMCNLVLLTMLQYRHFIPAPVDRKSARKNILGYSPISVHTIIQI